MAHKVCAGCRLVEFYRVVKLDSYYTLDYLIFSMINDPMRSLRWEVLLLRSMANMESSTSRSFIAFKDSNP